MGSSVWQPASAMSSPDSVSRAGYGDGHRHAVDGLDQPAERREVDLHVVVDGDGEVLGDRADEQWRPAPLDGQVDAGVGAVGVPDVQVTGQRQQRGAPRRRIGAQDHDRVGAQRGVAADAHRVVVGKVGGAVDADDEVVLGLAGLGRLVEHAGQLDPRQPLVLAEHVGEPCRAGQQAERRQAAARDGESLPPGAAPPPGAVALPHSTHGLIVVSRRNDPDGPSTRSQHRGE